MGVEGEIIAGYMKKEQQLYWFWGVLLKNSLLGTHGSLATAVPNSAPATDLAKKLRVPCQPLPLKFCTVTTRLLLALKLHWFQKVCNCSTGISWIPLKSTATISLTQTD